MNIPRFVTIRLIIPARTLPCIFFLGIQASTALFSSLPRCARQHRSGSYTFFLVVLFFKFVFFPFPARTLVKPGSLDRRPILSCHPLSLHPFGVPKLDLLQLLNSLNYSTLLDRRSPAPHDLDLGSCRCFHVTAGILDRVHMFFKPTGPFTLFDITIPPLLSY